MRLVRGIDKFAMLYLRSIFQRNKGIHIASIPDYFLTPLLAINNPNPPINKSRARIKRVALMAEAADMPNVPSANTWLASSAPRPPGNGMRNDNQPAVHAAIVCEKVKCIPRNDVMQKNSVTIAIAANSETRIANAKDDKCLLQNEPAIRSEAAINRTNRLFNIFRNSDDTGYLP
jgi:hypothetical protein